MEIVQGKDKMGTRELRAEDLYIGKKVSYEELDNIFDLLVVLDLDSRYGETGTIKYIGEPSDESFEVIKKCKMARPVYNRSFEYEDGIIYDE